jgi:hypothetical protein
MECAEAVQLQASHLPGDLVPWQQHTRFARVAKLIGSLKRAAAGPWGLLLMPHDVARGWVIGGRLLPEQRAYGELTVVIDAYFGWAGRTPAQA